MRKLYKIKSPLEINYEFKNKEKESCYELTINKNNSHSSIYSIIGYNLYIQLKLKIEIEYLRSRHNLYIMKKTDY